MPTVERRHTDRCAVDFFVAETSAERTFLHPALNLSATGVAVLVSDGRRAVDPTRTLALEFTLPTGVVVTTTARVAWLDDDGGRRTLGLAFGDDLGDEARIALERFVTTTASAQRRLRQSA